MRQLIILRGVPGCGKSTWLKDKGLEHYALNADNIRLLVQSPVMNTDGDLRITGRHDNKVWKLLFELLEQRMERGEFTIIDATHSSRKMVTAYKKLLEKYRYRIAMIDFKDVSLETILDQNLKRESYKFVPEEQIKMIHERIQHKDQIPPNYVEVIEPENFNDRFKKLKIDLTSKYEKVHVIGDIHGCFEPLNEYFKNNEFSLKEFYIFVGDYLDRGIQNSEVFEFIENIMDKPNVLLLEGNHGRWLKLWSEEKDDDDFRLVKSKDAIKAFEEFELSGITKSRAKKFYRKLAQLALFKFHSKTYLVTHGGLPTIPDITTATIEMIQGVGTYGDSYKVDQAFSEKHSNVISIHGHRNTFKEEIHNNQNTYNLCGTPEFGGDLRIIQIDKAGCINKYPIKNNLYNENLVPKKTKETYAPITGDDAIDKLNCSSLITSKDLGNNIWSFNFTRKAFHSQIWNKETIRARGLFVDVSRKAIVARSYDKFFNWGQKEETKSSRLVNTLEFPVVTYLKENGYLGLLSVNPENDEWFIASKTTDKGDYAEKFKDLFGNWSLKNKVCSETLKDYIKNHNVTFIFEVLDPTFDPHIIKTEKRIVLLDVVKNDWTFGKLPYENLLEVAETFNFDVKDGDLIFSNWIDFYKWHKDISVDFTLEHEGYVIEDSKGFMLKHKTPYYIFWKNVRNAMNGYVKGWTLNKKNFQSELGYKVLNFMNTFSIEEISEMSVIEFRNRYEEII